MKLLDNAKNNIALLTLGGIIATQGITQVYTTTTLERQLDETKENFKTDIDKVKKENTVLKKELTEQEKAYEKKMEELRERVEKQGQDLLKEIAEANKKKEASAVALASAEYPTQSISRGQSVSKGVPITMTLTFYGDGADENGGYAGIDAQGNKLVAGTVASNVYSFGTKFTWNGQVFTVRDRGGSHFNSSNRLDVFVPRMSGESDHAYKKRISNYGKKTITVYKIG